MMAMTTMQKKKKLLACNVPPHPNRSFHIQMNSAAAAVADVSVLLPTPQPPSTPPMMMMMKMVYDDYPRPPQPVVLTALANLISNPYFWMARILFRHNIFDQTGIHCCPRRRQW